MDIDKILLHTLYMCIYSICYMDLLLISWSVPCLFLTFLHNMNNTVQQVNFFKKKKHSPKHLHNEPLLKQQCG